MGYENLFHLIRDKNGKKTPEAAFHDLFGTKPALASAD